MDAGCFTLPFRAVTLWTDPALRPVLLAQVFRLLFYTETCVAGWRGACGENWAQILRPHALQNHNQRTKRQRERRDREADDEKTMTAEQAPPEAGCAVEIAADADDEHDAEEAATAPLSPTAGKPPPSPSPRGGCCRRAWDYGGVPEARGYALLAMGRGMAVMSNGASRPCRRFRGVRLRRGFSATLWQ